MRLREVFRFELEYALRRPTTWLYAGGLFGLAFLALSSSMDRPDETLVSSPANIAALAVLAGMLGMLITAALFADAALRDGEAGMDSLLFTSRLAKAEYLGGRFLAALAVNAALLIGIPAGQTAATLIASYFAPQKFGPFQAVAYLQPFLLFLLPNLVLVGATLFTIAMLARSVVPVYLGAIALVIVEMINAAGEIANPMLSALADPLGLATLVKITSYTTSAERNTRLIGFPETLVWNRVVWLTVAAIVLAVLHRSFRFAHVAGGGGRRERRTIIDPDLVRAEPVAVPRIQGTFGLLTAARQTLAVTRHSLEEIALSRAFLVVLGVSFGLALLWGSNVGDTVFDTSTWPVTHLVATEALTTRITPVIFMLIALYAGELVWKDRDAGVAEIADASPVPEGVTLLGRFLALVAMLATLEAVFMAAGVLMQALQGYYRFEPGLYVRILFGMNLVEYVLLAALAMTVHVIVNQKYLGHIVVMMAFVFTRVAGQLGIHHNLLVYDGDPGWVYSDMNGFGPFIGPFVWFKLYWAAWALLLAVVTNAFWVRGREPGLRRRLLEARARNTGPVARTAGIAVALIVLLGGFIFYNTNILNAYRAPRDAGLERAEYEKRYSRFEDLPQPTIVAADLRMEIYPEAPGIDLRGTYRMINRTRAAIDSVHVFTDPDVETRSISFDRGARPVVVDDEVRYRIYALERALAPGDSLQLAFDATFRPRGFTNSGNQTTVVRNGAYFNRRLLPFIGYQDVIELTGAEERRRFGLEPKAPPPSPDDTEARQYRRSVRNEDLAHVNAIVGTAADQIVVTPGVLRSSWTEKGRRYFRYEADSPISFGAVVSARYAVVEDRWNGSPPGSGNGVELRIFYHPTHSYGLDRMVRGMKQSLDYYTRQFGPYPYPELRIVETPRYRTGGSAHLATIAFAEDIFLGRVREAEIDGPFYGTAHEIAHQWWGAQVSGAWGMRGEQFLTESLANYSAMMVTEKTYGAEVARRVYGYQMDRYLQGRAFQSREVPLLEVENQAYIAYRKGAIAMYALREQIGEERVNTALRRYLERHRGAGPPYPTSLDLYAELRAVTPDSLHPLLQDLFETITLWDVRTRQATFEPTGTGEYQVTLEVAAKKVRADSAGKETEVPMNDLVEIGVFAPGDDEGLGEPLYLKQHRIRSGGQTIRVTVAREPSRAGIDPYRKLIDRQGDDNVTEVARSAAGSGGR